jgi:hypothetical protein
VIAKLCEPRVKRTEWGGGAAVLALLVARVLFGA